MLSLIVLGFLFAACGDRTETLGKACKSNDECDVGALRGVCLQVFMGDSYCTMLCEKDEDCGKPDFVCGDAEITEKGPLVTTKQDTKYCAKKKR